jgi:hypothetical protein
MSRERFTQYDDYPRDMLAYLRNYGPHFNRKLCDFAVSRMRKEESGSMRRIEPYTKEQVDNIMRTYGLETVNGQLYDETYVANMCKADYFGSSVPDEMHLAKYVLDTIDDPDGTDGQVFNRWYADMCYNGIAIEWSDML